MTSFTYQSAGVDLGLYNQAMERLPALMKRTHTPRVIELADGFAGLLRLDAGRYSDPVLASGTDGVGTKLKVAIHARKFDTVGIDLVAMCVNDVLCVGAEPLFFLDYLALGKDDPDLIATLVAGVSAGCVEGQSALLGGETAIMPDMYAAGDFDMAGFSVGVVDRPKLIDGKAVRPGDVVIGLASTGFHSNGYSLVRKVVFEHARLSVESHVADLGQTVGDALLAPTRIYVKPVHDVLKSAPAGSIHGLCHITGGGLEENIERILPESVRVRIDMSAWQRLPLFDWLQRLGNVERSEMFHVFNMGIGFTLIVAPEAVAAVRERLASFPFASWIIGEVVAGQRGVELL
ncbi:MAG: phosphoribosylformylglycinamidine cyclo-ligase [Planctomycetes bacterium]|nr:phosphoribosylformylglycinamidine cyclo-ligase [Planctomycetota bacterium]